MKLLDRLFKGKPRKRFLAGLELEKAIHQNGVITEKAARDRRSLSYLERQIISSVRNLAISNGYSSKMINMVEMEGQRDKELIQEPYKVKARFAYYQSPYYGHPVADASFIITQSNHPILIEHGNFGAEDLQKFGFKIPKYPTFEDWDTAGRPVYRGQ